MTNAEWTAKRLFEALGYENVETKRHGGTVTVTYQKPQEEGREVVRAPTKKQWEKWISSGSIPHATQVWCPTPGFNDGAYWFHWTGCDDHLRLLDLGMICRTKAEAIAKERKMLEAIKS